MGISCCGVSETMVKNTIIDWTKVENRVRFLEQIRLNENKIDDAIFNKCSGADQAQVIVDRICNNIINCITNACPNKDSSPSTSDRRKPWWSTSTQHAKSRKSLCYGI